MLETCQPCSSQCNLVDIHERHTTFPTCSKPTQKVSRSTRNTVLGDFSCYAGDPFDKVQKASKSTCVSVPASLLHFHLAPSIYSSLHSRRNELASRGCVATSSAPSRVDQHEQIPYYTFSWPDGIVQGLCPSSGQHRSSFVKEQLQRRVETIP